MSILDITGTVLIGKAVRSLMNHTLRLGLWDLKNGERVRIFSYKGRLPTSDDIGDYFTLEERHDKDDEVKEIDTPTHYTALWENRKLYVNQSDNPKFPPRLKWVNWCCYDEAIAHMNTEVYSLSYQKLADKISVKNLS